MKKPLRMIARGIANKDATASVRVLRPAVGYLRSIGKDVHAFLEGLGVDPARLFDPGARFPLDQVLEGWRRAEQLADNSDFGLALVSQIALGELARIEYGSEYLLVHLLLASRTVGEGLCRLSRYFAIALGTMTATSDPASGRLRLRHVVPAGLIVPRSAAEFLLGWICLMVKQASETAILPVETYFGHDPPRSIERHTRTFGSVPRFGVGENALVYAASDLRDRVRSYDGTLLAMLERRADDELARIADSGALVEQVRGQIISMLGGGDTSMARTAQALDLSIRTLTRRLAELGTTHMAILDRARADLARRYLLTENRPPREVAELLGFSEPSAFRRAFRRWYGEWPSGFQRSRNG